MFRIDLTGKKYGRLTVKSFVYTSLGNWNCLCICGNEKIVSRSSLTSGGVKSCGCLHTESLANRTRTHGMSKLRQYSIWIDMRKRCYDKKQKHYATYGGRGIKVCNRWNNSFENFWADMKEGYEDNLTIDRIDPNGDYSKENCRWATRSEQGNNKRNTVYLTAQGVTRTLVEWSRLIGIDRETLSSRLKAGMSEEETISFRQKTRKYHSYKLNKLK